MTPEDATSELTRAVQTDEKEMREAGFTQPQIDAIHNFANSIATRAIASIGQMLAEKLGSRGPF